MVSTLAFVFKIISPIIFSTVKKESFPHSRKFSAIKEIFHSQGSIPQSKKFSTFKEIFHNQGNFPQSRSFSTIKEIFYTQGNLSQSRKFTTNKDFYTVKKVSTNKDQKGSLKAKIFGPFNTKSFAKIFLAL